MDFLIPSKKVSKCPDCSGSGYLPLDDERMATRDDLTIEIGCMGCKGKGKITEKVDLSLESLKELLKWIITLKVADITEN